MVVRFIRHRRHIYSSTGGSHFILMNTFLSTIPSPEHRAPHIHTKSGFGSSGRYIISESEMSLSRDVPTFLVQTSHRLPTTRHYVSKRQTAQQTTATLIAMLVCMRYNILSNHQQQSSRSKVYISNER